MKLGINSNEMQKVNRCLVLKILMENSHMTRHELAAKTGLHKTTITNIINEFLDIGIITSNNDGKTVKRGELLHFRSHQSKGLPDLLVYLKRHTRLLQPQKNLGPGRRTPHLSAAPSRYPKANQRDSSKKYLWNLCRYAGAVSSPESRYRPRNRL